MRTRFVAAALTAAILAVPATAHAGPSKALVEDYTETYRQVVKNEAGPYAGGRPGRNLARDGTKDGPATTAELERSIAVMDRMIHPPTPEPLVVAEPVPAVAAPPAPASVTTTGSTSSWVDPACGSGGNPQVYDPSGTYWGKYQYDRPSWEADGGDPAAYGSASEAEQDQVASNAPFDRWPNC